MQAWSQFGSRFEDFALPEHRTAAVQCLNLLITNALQHVPDVLLYMSRIRNQSVFNFCAIPQVSSQYIRYETLTLYKVVEKFIEQMQHATVV